MQSTDCVTDEMPRLCFRNPVPQVLDAARYLDAAVSAHLAKNTELAEYLIRAANMDEVREWTESLWGKASQYVKARTVPGSATKAAQEQPNPGQDAECGREENGSSARRFSLQVLWCTCNTSGNT
ncbi:hypothetical protein PSCICO_02170 [Pseudomonas cichorii]|nr:hypothetical protein PSCICO_02170 [Pseudomonas cichorii]